jgi:predicted ATPase/DNA-binding SARP family transcriptional activator
MTGAGKLELHLFGSFEVWRDGVLLELAWPRRQARDLLQLLAMQPRLRLHKEQVVEALWPNETPEKRLYYILSTLRKTLEPELKQGVQSRYVQFKDGFLELHDVWSDVAAFETSLAQSSTDPLAYLQKAADLYRGELLTDSLYTFNDERQRLRQRYVAVLEQLLTLCKDQRQQDKWLHTLERLVATDINERHVQTLMQHYADVGQPQEVVRVYQQLVEGLKTLETAPEKSTTDLYEMLRGREFEGRSTLPVSLTLSPLTTTPLLGRERDMVEISHLLEDPATRLLTLTGLAGVGKTRLALELAKELETAFADGTALVSLAALRNADLLLLTLRQVLGVTKGSLEGHLQHKQMLLVLDNCEHLLDAMPQVVKLLEACPRLQVLATSRTPLHLRGETCVEVMPLELQSAVDLFQVRTRTTQPTLEITPEENIMVAKLCQELDSLPLAIELAAARRNVLSVQDIRRRLHERLDFKNAERGSPERHHSLRTALEWSLSLLSDRSRDLFIDLGVFAGSFTLDEAAEICGVASHELLGALEPLLDHHLLVATQQRNQQRFYMLETVRTYAGELLSQKPHAGSRERHANYFLQFAEEIEKRDTRGQPGTGDLDKLEAAYPDIRAALEHVFETDAIRALRFVTALGFFWYFRAYYAEGKRWYERALPLAKTEEARFGVYRGLAGLSTADGHMKDAKQYMEQCLTLEFVTRAAKQHAATLSNVAMLTAKLEGVEAAKTYYDQCLSLLEADDSPPALSIRGTALYNLGSALLKEGCWREAEMPLEQALEFYQRLGHERGSAHALTALASVALEGSETRQAEALAQRSLELCQKLNYAPLEVTAWLRLAQVDISKHQLKAALEKLLRALDIARPLDDATLADILLNLAAWGAAVQQYEWATRVLSLAEHLQAETDQRFSQYKGSLYSETKRQLLACLGERVFKTAWQLGASERLEDVVRALSQNDYGKTQSEIALTNSR